MVCGVEGRIEKIPGSTAGKAKEGTTFERWQKIRAKEEEDEAYRNRATKESLATIKERVGRKIEK